MFVFLASCFSTLSGVCPRQSVTHKTFNLDQSEKRHFSGGLWLVSEINSLQLPALGYLNDICECQQASCSSGLCVGDCRVWSYAWAGPRIIGVCWVMTSYTRPRASLSLTALLSGTNNNLRTTNMSHKDDHFLSEKYWQTFSTKLNTSSLKDTSMSFFFR